jgi:3-isopropylmalate dehydrogenase
MLPGDGIGPEVLREARRVLEAVADRGGHQFELIEGAIGAGAIAASGDPLPPPTRELCRSVDAVLLGAVGLPEQKLDGARRPEEGLLELRTLLGNYANLRPVRVNASLGGHSPLRPERVEGVDLLVVRELLGGIYFGQPRGSEADRAYNTEVYTEDEVRRIAVTAFDLARQRKRKVVSVDKANVLEVSMLWRRVASDVAAGYPDVAFSSMYVDNCAMQLVANPRQFDVILTNNMFGDILSDEASVLTGSLGMLPSASIGGQTGLYEPVHGSAPDIAGEGLANPIGAILSIAMLLEESLGLKQEGAIVRDAVDRVLADGFRTRDLCSGAAGETEVTTSGMGERVALGVAGVRSGHAAGTPAGKE